ncbi:hypothetical protein [Leptospira haakeii]|uniref:Transposase n=1 Tax=Leptospira haakeii TaxID=2023198 RepID=A0ABX4PK24_9LEPT|nr:hypothetical protein [Leptospira haakeii]PKA16137.1 hypothetical protein CH363_08285 [Leptospira haakeii]PKA18085.1 hypothetical protein CH377_19475 [Leptospira haakeii]
MNRIREKDIYIYDYMDLIFVKCPKCKSRAKISNNRVKCESCDFVKSRSENPWYGTYSLHVPRCPNCGNRSYYSKHNVKLKNPNLVVKRILCSGCKKASVIKVEVSRETVKFGIDPIFGLSLWLHVVVSNEDLWFYNYTHMQDIKNYISADIREKLHTKAKTMFTKLPKWMKSAKYRLKVLELIEKLEKK